MKLEDIKMESEEEFEELDEETLSAIHEELESFWANSSYTIEEVLDYHMAKIFVYYAKLHTIETVFKPLKIPITSKDKRISKNQAPQKVRMAICRRMNRRYYKDFVSKKLKDLNILYFQQIMRSLTETKTIETFVESTTKVDLDVLVWIIRSVLKDHELQELLLHEEIKAKYVATLYFIYSIFEEYKAVMEKPTEHDVFDHEQRHKNMLERKYNSLKKKASKKEKQVNQLNHSVYQLTQKTKELKAANMELYQQALQEIEEVKREKEQIEKEFQEEREFYIFFIEQMVQQTERMQSLPRISIPTNKQVLKNKKICIVGGDKVRNYREIVEKYGGTVVYVSWNDFNLIRGYVSKSDVVFFLVELAKHQHFKETLRASKDFGVPFHFINGKGNSLFEQELLQFARKVKQEDVKVSVY